MARRKYGLSIEEEVMEDIDGLADGENRSLSNMVETVLKLHLEAVKVVNGQSK